MFTEGKTYTDYLSHIPALSAPSKKMGISDLSQLCSSGNFKVDFANIMSPTRYGSVLKRYAITTGNN